LSLSFLVFMIQQSFNQSGSNSGDIYSFILISVYVNISYLC